MDDIIRQTLVSSWGSLNTKLEVSSVLRDIVNNVEIITLENRISKAIFLLQKVNIIEKFYSSFIII